MKTKKGIEFASEVDKQAVTFEGKRLVKVNTGSGSDPVSPSLLPSIRATFFAEGDKRPFQIDELGNAYVIDNFPVNESLLQSTSSPTLQVAYLESIGKIATRYMNTSKKAWSEWLELMTCTLLWSGSQSGVAVQNVSEYKIFLIVWRQGIATQPNYTTVVAVTGDGVYHLAGVYDLYGGPAYDDKIYLRTSQTDVSLSNGQLSISGSSSSLYAMMDTPGSGWSRVSSSDAVSVKAVYGIK